MRHMDRWTDHLIRAHLKRANLTIDQERALLSTYQTGCSDRARQAALTELWESHGKLVVAIAARYRRTGLELPDLVGAGHLGLYNAIARFDLARQDMRLAGFAAGWIRWSIIRHIRRTTGMIRLPESQAGRQLAQMSDRLIDHARLACLRENVEPTDQTLCERIGTRIGMHPLEVQRSLRLLQGGVVSLSHGLHADEPDAALERLLVDEAAASEDELITRLDRDKLRRRMLELARQILGDRERTVFLLRYMSHGATPVTLAALATRFGVSPERVHQLAGSARKKIAAALVSEGLIDARQPMAPVQRAA